MDPLNARKAPQFVFSRAEVLAERAVKRTLAGKNPAAQTCRACGAVVPCRPYDFKVRRHLRFVEKAGGLGSNTSWIMAKHNEMMPGQGAVCVPCMESFLQPYFAKVMRRLLVLFVLLCAPFPVALAIQHRRVHEMTNHGFMLACFLGVLFLLGLASLVAAWFADCFLSYKFNRVVLVRVAALERAPLRERFSAETYALQIGLRFSDETKSKGDEILSADDLPNGLPAPPKPK
jgi:hypothetical protein